MSRKYKGYTYRLTDDLIDIQYERLDSEGNIATFTTPTKLYEIEGLKPSSEKPYLKTVIDCKNYIDAQLEGAPVIKNKVGEALKTARLKAGLSQMALGLEMGIDADNAQKQISYWERGGSNVPAAKVRQLARILNIDPLDLLP